MKDDIELVATVLLEKFLRTKSEASLKKLKTLIPEIMPHWHHRMVLDQSRFDFYKKEIDFAVKDKIVLDLGAGSGLLTQLALQAGAKHVYAVEGHPLIAVCFAYSFEEEIKAGKVTLLAKSSLELLESDLPFGKPEVVIHEVFGANPLTENILGTFADLHKRSLIDSETTIVPQHFSIHGCLYQTSFSDYANAILDKKFWYLEQLCYFGRTIRPGPKLERVGQNFQVAQFDLKNIPDVLEKNFQVEAQSEANCLRSWFIIEGKVSNLTTDSDHQKDSHWGNVYYYLKCLGGTNEIAFSYANNKASFSRVL